MALALAEELKCSMASSHVAGSSRGSRPYQVRPADHTPLTGHGGAGGSISNRSRIEFWSTSGAVSRDHDVLFQDRAMSQVPNSVFLEMIPDNKEMLSGMREGAAHW